MAATYKKTVGVYELISRSTGFRYVGSSSYSVENRLAYHKTRLKQGRHYNDALQAAYNTEGGWDAFKVVMYGVEDVKAMELSKIRYWSRRGKCYNLAGSTGKRFNKPSDGSQSRAAKARCTTEWRAAVSERVKDQHKRGKFGRQTWSKN